MISGGVSAPRLIAIGASWSACGSSGASAISAWSVARSTDGEPLAVYSSALATGVEHAAGQGSDAGLCRCPVAGIDRIEHAAPVLRHHHGSDRTGVLVAVSAGFGGCVAGPSTGTTVA